MQTLDTQKTSAGTSTGKRDNNNALTHGGTSQKLILPTENEADFEALLDGLRAEYQPETHQHHLFIEQLAHGHWFLQRRQRAFNSIEASIYAAADNDAVCLNEDDFRRLALAERYKTAAERSLKRALQNAESIRKDRNVQQNRQDRIAKWQAEQDLRERRLKLQKDKQQAAEAKKAQRTPEPEPPRRVLNWPVGPVGIPVPGNHPAQALADRESRPEQP